MNRVFHTEESAWSSWISKNGLAVLAYSYVVGALVLTNLIHGPLRILLAAPLLSFLPGYAVLDALFPTAHSTTRNGSGRLVVEGVSWGARVAIAVGLSIVLLPLLVVLLGMSGIPLTTTPITVALVAVVTIGITIGSYRRIRTGTEAGYRVPTERWRTELSDATGGSNSRIDSILTIVLIIVVVLAMTGFAYGLAAPDRSASYSEVALLNQQGDALVAGNYPGDVTQGAPLNVTMTIKNQEGVDTTYTVLVVLERVRTQGDDVQVLERQQLDRREVTLANGETRREPFTVKPNMLGEDLRLSFLVVEGNTPKTIDPSTADHHLFLWLDVSATDTQNQYRGDAASTLDSPTPGTP